MFKSFAFALTLAVMLVPMTAPAGEKAGLTRAIVDGYILPRFGALAGSTQALEQTAAQHCTPGAQPLTAAYHTAFDDWVAVSHLRFGPSEVDDRAFAIAFWPDTKGFTPRALTALIDTQDPAGTSARGLADVSIAGRGFYALEFLMFDDVIRKRGDPAYRCALVQAITADIADNAAAILTDWRDTYAALLATPGGNSPYRSQDEAVQELFKSLNMGLQFTADTRLGRPMGKPGRPRPKRAEARRSDRSLRHVQVSLASLAELAALLSTNAPEVQAALNRAFRISLRLATRLDDPVFAGVEAQQGRFRVEALQSSINQIRTIASTKLGPALGVAAGFNSLDGD